MPDFYAARELLQQAVTDRAFPGAAFGVWSKGSIIAAAGVGRFTYDATSPEASAETIYDLASVSKVLATAPLAMRLWQRGILNLEQPVGEILPEFLAGDTRRNAVTIHMLLAHTSGLPAHLKLYRLPEVERAASPEEAAELALTACLTAPLIAEPGSRAVYSDIGYILLGRAIERLAGDSLNSLCDQEVFEPLELKSTCFRPAPELRSHVAPTRDWEWRHRILQGEVQDENCALLGGVAGHAGVFSTVGDIFKLAAAILAPGDVFTGAAVDRFTRRESAPPGTSRTLGWDTPTPPSQSGSYFSAHSIGHLGYSGTSLWIDLDRQIAVALLTNRVFTEGGPANAKIQPVRPAFHDAVMKSLLAD